ncbi:peptidyl-prolyl cis-trans isomerase G-like isoform X2 [Haliotis cracherodii]|uniref:peptidyl-prolyl cis-trans isomerase G-like isoform X2 n=1 Tax=Haliotis cracherodii TaxID=6455 RepID=UPI0039E7FB95
MPVFLVVVATLVTVTSAHKRVFVTVVQGRPLLLDCSDHVTPVANMTFAWEDEADLTKYFRYWSESAISQGGNYTCTADSEGGRKTVQFTVTVEYMDNLTLEVTPKQTCNVNNVTATCIVDSNAEPTLTIHIDGTNDTSSESGRRVSRHLAVTCGQAVRVECTASLSNTSRQQSTKLDVLCAPNSTGSFTIGSVQDFSVYANPSALYTWKRTTTTTYSVNVSNICGSSEFYLYLTDDNSKTLDMSLGVAIGACGCLIAITIVVIATYGARRLYRHYKEDRVMMKLKIISASRRTQEQVPASSSTGDMYEEILANKRCMDRKEYDLVDEESTLARQADVPTAIYEEPVKKAKAADPPDAVASFYEELQGAPKGNDTYEEVKQGRADDPPTTRDARPPVPSRRNLRKSIRLTPVDPKQQVSSEDNTHPPTVPPRHQVSSEGNTYEELNTGHGSQRSLEDQCESRRPSDTGSNHSGYEMIPDADTLRKLRQRAQKRAQIDSQPKQKRLLFGWMSKKARGKAAKQTDADVSDKIQVRGATVLGGQGHRSEESDVERYRDDVINTKPGGDKLYVNKGDGDATQKCQSFIDMSNIVTVGPAYEDMTGDLQASTSGRKKSHRRSQTLERQRHFRKIAENPGAGYYDNVGPLKTKAEENADYSNTETRSADSRYNEEPMEGEADTSQADNREVKEDRVKDSNTETRSADSRYNEEPMEGEADTSQADNREVKEDRVKEASISGRKKSLRRSQTLERQRHFRKIAENPGAGYYDNIGPLKTKAEETADYSNTETRSADSRYNEEPMEGEADTSQADNREVKEDRVKEASISGRKKSLRRSQTLERQRHFRKIAENPGAGYYDNIGPLKTKAEETADYSNTETRSADSRYNEEPMEGEADTSQADNREVKEDRVKEASISGRKKSLRRSQTLERQRHFRKIAENPGAGYYDNIGPLKTKAEETADYSNTETRSADSRYNEEPMEGEADTSQADNREVKEDRVKDSNTETRSADSRYNEEPMEGEADTSQADNREVKEDRVKETHLSDGDTTSA